ncbi:MAG TPA: flagellar basal body-associated FliL family protein, partial [Alphaproteobacteria bacterium]
MAKAKAAVIDDDGEVAEEAEGASEQQPKKKLFVLPSLKVLIIGGAAFLLLAGGGAGAYFFFFAGKHEAKTKTPAAKTEVFVDLPEVMVNLSNGRGERTQYLKIKIVLELPEQKMVEQIQPIMPRVMDAFQTYLRELRPSDLDGSAGLYRLKEELTRRVNAA